MNLDELLKLCEAATPGPWWRTDPPWGDGTSVHAGPSDDPHTATKIICEFDPFDVQFSPRYDDVDSSDIVEFDHVTDDMAFIAAAREHFPACLRKLKRVSEIIAAVNNHETEGHGSLYWFSPEQLDELRQLFDLAGGEA